MSRLDTTAARLRALLPVDPDAYAVETALRDEPGWWGVDALPVERWCADARERDNPSRLASVAAVSVGAALAHAVLGRVTAALALDMCAWDVAAGNLVVHRAAAAHLDRLALRRPTAWVTAPRNRPTPRPPVTAGRPGTTATPTDPGLRIPALPPPPSPSPSALPSPPPSLSPSLSLSLPERAFSDETALIDAVAAAAVTTLTPLFARVRAATRFGLVPLWNSAADSVRLTATFVPLYAGRPARPGLAPALLDALVTHGAPVRGRGRDQPLAGRPERVPVRAACCFHHRTDPPVAHPSDALCTTCPLLDPTARADRYRAFLDRVTPTPITPAATGARDR